MTSQPPDPQPLLRMHTERIADVARDAELDAPVPSCPGWSLRDLVVHLGGVDQWATHAVVEGTPTSDQKPSADEVVGGDRVVPPTRLAPGRSADLDSDRRTRMNLDDRDRTAQFG